MPWNMSSLLVETIVPLTKDSSEWFHHPNVTMWRIIKRIHEIHSLPVAWHFMQQKDAKIVSPSGTLLSHFPWKGLGQNIVNFNHLRVYNTDANSSISQRLCSYFSAQKDALHNRPKEDIQEAIGRLRLFTHTQTHTRTVTSTTLYIPVPRVPQELEHQSTER